MCQKAAQEWRIIMGILTRFKDIMSANINALLDKCEDPEKMIDQYMRNLESDLGKVKAETASVMAEETRCKRELDECTADVAKYQSYAEKALKAGNEADARTFLEKKQQLVSKQATLQQTYNIAADNAAKMRQMHDKLCKDIQSLEARRDAVKAKVAAAKAQERINKVGSLFLCFMPSAFIICHIKLSINILQTKHGFISGSYGRHTCFHRPSCSIPFYHHSYSFQSVKSYHLPIQVIS